MKTKPVIHIRYCTQCQWMLRAAYYAQEILSTFAHDIQQVNLIPENEIGGHFQIHCDEHLIWDRKDDGGFPQTKDLKQRIRDCVDPERDLGHVDDKK